MLFNYDTILSMVYNLVIKCPFLLREKKQKLGFSGPKGGELFLKTDFFFFKTGYFNFKATLEECFKDIFNSRIFKSRIDLIYIEP